MFVGLVLMLTYVQVWAAPSLKINPANTRAVEEEMQIERGLILSADDQSLAKNDQQGQYFLRTYPFGDLTESPWLGFQQPRYGRAGVERVYNRGIDGAGGAAGRHEFLELIMGRPSGEPISSSR